VKKWFGGWFPGEVLAVNGRLLIRVDGFLTPYPVIGIIFSLLFFLPLSSRIGAQFPANPSMALVAASLPA
jgi:hypothetical protein